LRDARIRRTKQCQNEKGWKRREQEGMRAATLRRNEECEKAGLRDVRSENQTLARTDVDLTSL
jgi:hypothetical protein